VKGKGIRILKAAGIKVSAGLMKKDCEKLNEVFVKVMKTGMPFVTVKTAMSLDGKIATREGDSQWISGVKSRDFVHELRNQNDAILVGTNTILKDNPQLTCRLKKKRGRNPARIILDRKNRIPLTAKVFANSKAHRVVYVSGSKLSTKREQLLKTKNIEVLKVKTLKSGFDLKQLMKLLAQKELNSILIEGGGEINSSALEAGIVDRVFAFISPILVGGQQAPSPIGGDGVAKITKAIRLDNMKVIPIGDDLMVEAEICSAE
jgi:diaminohydroxyphosphoribosylaminopyrimidine deaminase/5-amino-6-(5-phosphoribosylamino)uracil reductase